MTNQSQHRLYNHFFTYRFIRNRITVNCDPSEGTAIRNRPDDCLEKKESSYQKSKYHLSIKVDNHHLEIPENTFTVTVISCYYHSASEILSRLDASVA